LVWGWDKSEYPQQLAASKLAAAALAAGPCTIMGAQSTDSLSEFSSHQGPQPVTIWPYQWYEYRGKQQIEAKVQADVLVTVQPLLAMLPHISLHLERDTDLAATSIIADTLGPTTTKLKLFLPTNATGVCGGGGPLHTAVSVTICTRALHSCRPIPPLQVYDTELFLKL
jgi:hypothetical protein